MKEQIPLGWADIDVGKGHHWLCLIDDAGTASPPLGHRAVISLPRTWWRPRRGPSLIGPAHAATREGSATPADQA